MRRALVVVMFVAFWLLPDLGWSAEPHFRTARPEDLFLRSPSCVAPVFSSAQSIEVFRVAPPYEKGKTTRSTFREQKIIAGPRLLGGASTRALGKQLEHVYCFDWPNLYCAFEARYGVRIHFPTHSVEVLVCPHCGEVRFFKGAQWSRSAYLAWKLLPLLQKAFPDYAATRSPASRRSSCSR
jgi:hypothetical protein